MLYQNQEIEIENQQWENGTVICEASGSQSTAEPYILLSTYIYLKTQLYTFLRSLNLVFEHNGKIKLMIVWVEPNCEKGANIFVI